MSLRGSLRYAIIALSSLFSFQIATFLWLFVKDYRRGENGITKGLITLTVGLLVGSLTTAIHRTVAIVTGQQFLPLWHQGLRLAAHLLCVIGMHLVYDAIITEHGERYDDEIIDSADSE